MINIDTRLSKHRNHPWIQGAFCNVKLFFIGKQSFTDLFRKLPLVSTQYIHHTKQFFKRFYCRTFRSIPHPFSKVILQHREGLHYHFETNRKWRQIDWFSVGTFNVFKVDWKCVMVHDHTLPIQAIFALYEWIMMFVRENLYHSLCITFFTRRSFLFTPF